MNKEIETKGARYILRATIQAFVTIVVLVAGALILFGDRIANSLPRHDPPEYTACISRAYEKYSPVLEEAAKYKEWGVPKNQLSAEDRAEKERITARLGQANVELDVQRDKCLERYNHATWQALKDIEAEQRY